MSKVCYRFYGGLLESQARWLNRMADAGYRLRRVGKLRYEFEDCAPGQYRYDVEFIGQMTAERAADYARFLEDCGCRVFFRSINLNWNVGKVEVRPWADAGARLATNAATFNRELLIVEHASDGRPFALHTTYADRIDYYKRLRRPWLYLLLASVVLGVAMRAWLWGAAALIAAVGTAILQVELTRLQRRAKIEEGSL